MKTLKSLALACAMYPLSITALAGPIEFSFDGVVDTALAGNAFGLIVGEKVAVNGEYDDMITGTGTETIFFNSGSGNSLNIRVGSLQYNETDDVEFLGLFPRLIFFDGKLTDINFSAQTPPEFFTALGTFAGDRIAPGVDCTIVTNCGITGIWDFQSFVSSSVSVPEPATTALFVVGLAALGLITRRHKT